MNMKKMLKMTKRIFSIALATMLLASCMFVSLPEAVYAGSQLPSVTRFATPADLVNPNKFTLHTGNGKGVAQKVNFGHVPCYIAGKDSDGSLVLMCAPANPLFDNQFNYDDNRYKGSDIEAYLKNNSSGALSYFTDAEVALMISPTVYTNTCDSDEIDDTSDKLYLAYGNLNDNYITVGANSKSSLNNGIKIGLTTSNSPNGSPYADGSYDEFWLRAPDVNDQECALYAKPGNNVYNRYNVLQNLPVVPAFNLNLSSVLFASAAPAASSGMAFDNAMTFRYENNGQFNSTAEVTGQTLSVTYDAGDSDVYICAQGKDGDDDWFSCERVTDTKVYTADDVHSGTDLSKCRIWLEKYDLTSNLIYAEYAAGSNVGGGSHGSSHGSSAPISADAPIECEHEFVWQTIEDPNFNFDGLEGEVCSKCGFKGLIVPTSAYSWVLGSYGLPMIEDAKPGDMVVFEFKQWNSFPKWFMERIAAKPDVTYVFRYFYENNNYEVTIKPHTPIPLDFDYYGPEKLAALFESTVTPR